MRLSEFTLEQLRTKKFTRKDSNKHYYRFMPFEVVEFLEKENKAVEIWCITLEDIVYDGWEVKV